MKLHGIKGCTTTPLLAKHNGNSHIFKVGDTCIMRRGDCAGQRATILKIMGYRFRIRLESGLEMSPASRDVRLDHDQSKIEHN